MEDEFSYQFFSSTKTALDAMYEAIAAARQSVFWELYIFLDDAEGRRFVELLARKARAGVKVVLILDAVGSSKFHSENALRRAGARVLWYNRLWPLRLNLPRWLKRASLRNHRKVLVIDEEVGFVGGVNVSTVYREWDDLQLKIVGKPVRSLLYGFAKSYVKSGGDKKEMRHIFHPRLAAGGLESWKEKISFIFHSPVYGSRRRLWRTFYKAVEMARESVTFLSPYYVPERRFLKLIARAARRGVKVNIMLPARTDVDFMNFLAQKYYNITQKAGAKIFLLNAMNHGKALLVDDKFGMVSSVNLLPRSFSQNSEAGVCFTEQGMVSELNSILSQWRQGAVVAGENDRRRLNWRGRFCAWLAEKMEKYV